MKKVILAILLGLLINSPALADDCTTDTRLALQKERLDLAKDILRIDYMVHQDPQFTDLVIRRAGKSNLEKIEDAEGRLFDSLSNAIVNLGGTQAPTKEEVDELLNDMKTYNPKADSLFSTPN